jgi:hypothetical protein
MDKVLSTNNWREYIPANGRRISRKISKTEQEVVLLDRYLPFSFVQFVLKSFVYL